VKFQRRARDVRRPRRRQQSSEDAAVSQRFTLPFGYPQATNIVFHNGVVLGRSIVAEERKEPMTEPLKPQKGNKSDAGYRQVVVVTGASIGIGESTAKNCWPDTERRCIGARRKDRLDAAVKEISARW